MPAPVRNIRARSIRGTAPAGFGQAPAETGPMKVFRRGLTWWGRRSAVKRHLRKLSTPYGKRVYLQNRMAEAEAVGAETERQTRKKHEFQDFLRKKMSRYEKPVRMSSHGLAVQHGRAYEKRGMLTKAAESYLSAGSYYELERIVKKMKKKKMLKSAAHYFKEMSLPEEYRRGELERSQAEHYVALDLLEKSAEMQKKVGNYDEALSTWALAQERAQERGDEEKAHHYLLMQAGIKEERNQLRAAAESYLLVGKTSAALRCAKKLERRNPYAASGIYSTIGESVREGRALEKAHRYVRAAETYLNPGGKSDLGWAKKNIAAAKDLLARRRLEVRASIQGFKDSLDTRLRTAGPEAARVLRACSERIRIALQGEPSTEIMISNLSGQFSDYLHKMPLQLQQEFDMVQQGVRQIADRDMGNIRTRVSTAANYITEAKYIAPKKIQASMDAAARAVAAAMESARTGATSDLSSELESSANSIGAAETVLEIVSARKMRRGIKIAKRLENGMIVRRGRHRGRRLRRLKEALMLRNFLDVPVHQLVAARIAERMNNWDAAIVHYENIKSTLEAREALEEELTSRKMLESAKRGIARSYEMSGNLLRASEEYAAMGLIADYGRAEFKLGRYDRAAMAFAQAGAAFESKRSWRKARQMRRNVAKCFELAGQPLRAVEILRGKQRLSEFGSAGSPTLHSEQYSTA